MLITNNEKLYNLKDTSAQTLQFVHDLKVKCDYISAIEIDTPEIVYQSIIMCINPNKNDVNSSFKSNAIRNGVDIIYKYLT